MKVDSNHSFRSPWSRKSWSEMNPTAMKARPGPSTRVARFRYGGSNRKALEARKPTTPIGTLM